MSMISAVVFDRDGVLADFDVRGAATFFASLLPISLDELAARWQEWGDTTGFPRNLAEEETFWRGLWDRLGDELKLPSETRKQLHQFNYTDFLRPFPDARPALLATRQRGLGVGVLSNFTLASLEASLAAIGLGHLVDAACAATVIGAAKPAPDAYLSVTRLLSVEPEECLFFDDERPCVEGALGVGMQAYLVDRRRADHDLERGIVSDLGALPAILDLQGR